MIKKSAALEWQVLLDDEWTRSEQSREQFGTPSPPEPISPRQQSCWVFFGPLLVLIVGMSWYWWLQTIINSDEIPTILTDAVIEETQTEVATSNQPNSPQQVEETIIQTARQENASAAEVTIEDVDLAWNRAEVRLRVTETLNGTDIAYRQMRVYRKRSGEWQLVPPDEVVWGALDSLATPRIHYQFRQKDADTVHALYPTLDQRYTKLRKDLGLPPVHKPISVTIKPAMMSHASLRPTATGWTITVPSPAFLTIPMALTDEEILSIFLTSALVQQVLEEVQQRDEIQWEWRQMPEAFRRWYVVREHDALAVWHAEMTTWLYTSRLQAALLDSAFQRLILPKSLEQECQQARVATLSIAWAGAMPHHFCPRDKSVLMMPTLPNRLDELLAPNSDWTEASNEVTYWTQMKGLETVLDYVVTEYGQQQLLTLFVGFSQHTSWETLIPTTFGVSSAEFEAGWHNYLRTVVLTQSGAKKMNLRRTHDVSNWPNAISYRDAS
ncbi:hypothetical protein KFU94_16340 [Chloroflexi bacterium TSY]|nr:hypothetical protein [Chloroflexi bacterium TSY]